LQAPSEKEKEEKKKQPSKIKIYSSEFLMILRKGRERENIL